MKMGHMLEAGRLRWADATDSLLQPPWSLLMGLPLLCVGEQP